MVNLPRHARGAKVLKAVSSPLRLQILNLIFDNGALSYTELMNSLKKCEIDVIDHDFGQQPQVIVSIPKSQSDEKIIKLKALVFSIPLDAARALGETENMSVDFIHTTY